MTKRINVTQAALPSMEEYIQEISSIWDSHWLTNMGEKHLELEKGLKEYLGASNITLFTNGHLALENCLAALNLRGNVITTPFTFASTTHAIVRNGLTPFFCDVKEDDYTMDPDKIESLITPETSAIVPVHVYGNICETEKIQKIADKHGLKVIYDGAHAFGETINGQPVANFGDATMFSFHATKVFHTVEGGAVTYNDPALQARFNYMKNFGIPGEDRIVYTGGNAKMSEFHAAMGLCNLRHVDEYIEGRKKAAERYIENLSGVPGLKVWKPAENVKSNYAYFPVIFDGAKYTRDEAYERLAKENIGARKYFYPLINDCECYPYQAGGTPVAKWAAARVLTLPMYPGLELADVDRICEIITE